MYTLPRQGKDSRLLNIQDDVNKDVIVRLVNDGNEAILLDGCQIGQETPQ